MPFRDRIKDDIPGAFLELCKYQQNIIKQYEEYIEKYLHQHIKEKDTLVYDQLTLCESVYKEITLPETKIVLNCSPYVLHTWKCIKETNPLISPEYFIELAYREREEKKNG